MSSEIDQNRCSGQKSTKYRGSYVRCKQKAIEKSKYCQEHQIQAKWGFKGENRIRNNVALGIFLLSIIALPIAYDYFWEEQYFSCSDDLEIEGSKVLDGTDDCPGGLDEQRNYIFGDSSEAQIFEEKYRGKLSWFACGFFCYIPLFIIILISSFPVVETNEKSDVDLSFDDLNGVDLEIENIKGTISYNDAKLISQKCGVTFQKVISRVKKNDRVYLPTIKTLQIEPRLNPGRVELLSPKTLTKSSPKEKKETEKKHRCSYCNSGTNYICDEANGCQNGICKKCRDSGKANMMLEFVVTETKWYWLRARGYYRKIGYNCKECSKSKWVDDGSDVGY